MKQFRLLNNMFGWLAFLVAAVTYCLTVEPTASFWDCPEFILSGNKLEVGHPPGAPFFMLTANFFSLFAAPDKVAYMVNIMSALLSAGGILFLFWTITHLTRRLIVGKSNEITPSQTVTILASGMVGALAYTWSDTYWFSAVEGEVYGYSSLFTAVVFWLILKWEESDDSPSSDRWLILIAYLTGLSIGVHLLNLLCIPAIVLVAYFKKFPKANWRGTLLALVVSAALVAVVLYGIVPGVVKVGGWFELLFVNVLGMPFNTGVIVYLLLLFGTLITGIIVSAKGMKQSIVAAVFTFAIALLGIPFYGHNLAFSIIIGIAVLAAVYLAATRYVEKAKKFLISLRAFNTVFICMLVIMMGYASYTLIVIRSSANTPMDQNSPEDIFTLGSYLNREQYGTRPLFYGQHYASEIEFDENGKAVKNETSPTYVRTEAGDYERLRDESGEIEYNGDYVYKENMLFPRMYSQAHVEQYYKWTGREMPKQSNKLAAPSQADNIKFFLRYQVNHMYWRYFMWNFVGRQNDIQGHGEKEHGNWITGIPFLDDMRLGDQDLLPTELKENKGHNVFFALPLLLGILGIIWQLIKGEEGRKQSLIVFMLFFMTGLAIVLYLNQTPMQPRERDYAYAGSFYAFAIWIGMGVAAISHFATGLVKGLEEREKLVINGIVAAICLFVPLQMVSQTWDDHDRSGRYACRDFGQNYLNSLPEEGCPIIFTCGDNDTFPLWYNQEVEGVRTDVRVCNLSYLTADWYIDQMRRPAYDSPALPITLERDDYFGNNNQIIYVLPEEGQELVLEYLDNNPEKAKLIGENIYNVKNIINYWVREANNGDKSEGRKVVEEMMEYIRPKLKERAETIISETKRYAATGGFTKEEAAQNIRYGEHLKRVADSPVVIPSSLVVIPIDYDAVRRSGMKIPQIVKDGIYEPEYMVIDMASSYIQRYELIILDMLANANWERPIYMATTVGNSNYPPALEDFFVLEGLAYRITPFNWTEITSYSEEMGIYEAAVDTEKFYDNVMNRFKWGGIKENEDYYADETIRRMVTTHRSFISMLAGSMFIELNYIDAADTDRQIEQTKKIIALLERCETEFPEKTTGFDPYRDSYNAVKNANIYLELYEIQKENKNTGIYLGDDTCNMLKEKYLEQSANVMRRCMEYLRLYESYSKQERNADLEATYTQLLQYATQYFFNGMKEDEIDGALEKYSVGFTLQDIYRQLKKARK